MELRASELVNALEREELDAGFSFGLPDNETIAQQPAWNYPVMALLPRGHELAAQPVLPIAELLAFPLLSCHAERQPGLSHQMRTIVRRHSTTLTLAGEARTLSGYVTRIAAGLAVGLVDAGHITTLCRSDVLGVPLREDEHITTFVQHKQKRFGLPDALQRFIAHAKTLQ